MHTPITRQMLFWLQDAFWTASKSVKVRNSDRLHPEGKSLALDGRLRSTPADNRYLSPFFMITRTKTEELVNMKLHYPTVTAKIDIQMDLPGIGKKRDFHIAFNAPSMPQTPVLYNESVIDAHTKLVAMEDTEGRFGEACLRCLCLC
jgi:hypothetical protein